jgi:hypothetical protein
MQIYKYMNIQIYKYELLYKNYFFFLELIITEL